MNTFNTTLQSPEWAILSELGDDGNHFMHYGPELSKDPLISTKIERMDILREDNTFGDGHWSICLSTGRIDLDLDYNPLNPADIMPSELARRIAAQLLEAADVMDSLA